MVDKLDYNELEEQILELENKLRERDTSEAVLREQVNMYKSLTDGITDVILNISLDGNLLYVSDAVKEFSGYDPKTEIGENMIKYMACEDDYEPALALIKQVTEEKTTASFEFLYLSNLSEPFPVELTGKPVLKDGEVESIMCSMRNITMRKKSELALKTSENEKLAILESIRDLLIYQDRNHNILWANNSEAKSFNLPMGDLVGKKCYEIFFGRDSQCSDCSVQKTLHDGKVRQAEIDLPSGEIYVAQIAPVKDKDGVVTGIVEILRDVTAQKKAEKSLLESERLSAIGELASGVAHDFNNALQLIFGNVELALLGDSVPEIKEYLGIIKSSARDASSRVKQLQRFAGKNVDASEYCIIDINSVLEDSLAQSKILWKDEVQKQGLRIDIRTNYQNGVSILGNSSEFTSVFHNIIKNSVQAMPDGGVIMVDTKKQGEQVVVTITDDGIGMDEKTKARIFQPFYSTKGFEQGTGLGMSCAYSIITEHKGSIHVTSSEPGVGTSIEISLPYAERKATFEEKQVISGDDIAKLLWVDDEVGIRKMAKRLVKRLGHEVDVADGGNEALDYLTKKQYDLMITDVGMPDMNGWQLAEQIKGKHSGMTVAVVTGWGDDSSADWKKKHNVAYVLGKPINAEQIKQLIYEVLQKEKVK